VDTNGLRRGHLNIAAELLAALFLAGCSTSPAQNMLGSFFPAWMLCAAAGIVIAVLLRQVLCALDVNQYLIAPPLTYLSIAVSGTLLVWLLWFGH
jgi:YtcA family